MPETGADVRRSAAAEAALGHSSGSRLLRVLDGVPDLIAHVDAQGVSRFINKAAASWFGFTPEEASGRHISELLGPDRWEYSKPYVEAVLAGEPQELLRTLILPDGDLAYTRVRYLPFFEGDRVVGFDVLGTDITSRVVAEESAQALAASNAVMQERVRVAADIHDIAIQLLFGAALDLDAVDRDTGRTDQRLQRAAGSIDQAIRELRNSIYQLSRNLGPDPIVSGVDRIVANAANWLGYTPQVTYDGDLNHLDTDVAESLLAVANECVSNIVRHAHSTSSAILVRADEQHVTLTVTDNGVGPGESTRRSGLGNMATRATNLGGSCTVEAIDPQGTRITWQVPADAVEPIAVA